jgi:cell division protein FtsL
VTPAGEAEPAAGRPESSPRPRFTSRAAVLVVVVCAIGLSLAYPIREYIAERRQIDQLEAENAQLGTSVLRLEAEQREIGSPSYIEQIARDQLHMCFPAQTCYVIVPSKSRVHGKAGRTQPAVAASSWYGALWASVRAADKEPPR